MVVIREAFPADLDQLLAVARFLDTVNLPNDRGILERTIELSRRSFRGEIDVFKREYLFVLEDLEAKRLIGTCMVHAQHGTRRAPHIFFEVQEDERYSETLDRHFRHHTMRIGYNYEGPTEIGGLILLPDYRGKPGGLGKLLSYVRFLYIGLHRERFRDEVLSELLPPLEPDGTSVLWEHLGRHFTGLSYQEADRLSKDNKEFIRTLFPQGLIYTCLLPSVVQAVIGVVGPQTRGVEKMLRAIGFEYAGRIDPFDGGPHFSARTDDIVLVRDAKRAPAFAAEPAAGSPQGIVSVERDGDPHFVAVMSRYVVDGERVGLPEATRQALGIAVGDSVGYVAVA